MINTRVFIKRIFAVASSLIMFSCSNEDELATKSEYINRVTVECEDVEFEPEVQTRTSYASNLAFSWSLGDTLGIYPIGGDQVAFPISSGEGSKSAAFDGGAWALRSTYQYAGYFPFSANNYHNSQTAIPFSYEGQSQNGSGTMTNLGKYDYMAAAATTPTATGNVSLQMKRLGCFMRLSLTVPEPCTLTKVTVESNGVKFGTAGTIDLTSSAPALKVTKTSATMQTTLSNVTTRTSNENVIVWIQTAPVDLSAETLVVSATASNGDVFSGTVAGKKMSANGGYGYSVTLTKNGTGASGEDPNVDFDTDTTPYVAFHAESTQTLTMSKAVETLEYSVNNGAWTSLGTSTITFGGSNGDLRLRGKSSYGTAKGVNDHSKIIFGNISIVTCSGDIRTLIDYENYKIADTGSARFCSLFRDCTSLSSTPDLAMENLADRCYYYMFKGCTYLQTVPSKLPATTLAPDCYYGMFYECELLNSTPSLPAMSLAEECYNYMFYGCKSLEVAPLLPATTLAPNCYYGMFERCESLKTVQPELPATSLEKGCYYSMFQDCKSLENAPALPATNLEDFCYANMFGRCRSLLMAPVLPATNLVRQCYYFMFGGCHNLSYIKMLATNINASECLYGWTTGVTFTESNIFVKNIEATWSNDGVVPNLWTVQYD